MTTKSKVQDKSKMGEIDDHILKMFDVKKRLGKGAYGIVWKAVDKRTSDVVAVKKIFDAFRDETDAQRTFREIIFLNAFRSHPNIVKLHNVFRASNNLDIYLVFEYMESDLHNIIKRGTVLKDIHKRYVMYQLINAIKYIHSGNVIHRDLKPSNILIDCKCRCKLADFGLARSVSNRESNTMDFSTQLLTDYVATRWYRAPEILVASKRYTKGIDMWSLGCILGEMLRGKPLFQGNSTINQIERIVCTLPEITEHDVQAVGADFGAVLLSRQINRERRTSLDDLLGDVPNDAMHLVKSLLVLDPLARLTAHQALDHPYITRFRHSSAESDLDVDILPPFSDDVRLTVPEYRSKLYEIVDDVPKTKPSRSISAQARRPSHSQILNCERRSNSKSNSTNTHNLKPKESRDRSMTHSHHEKLNNGQERVPMKKSSPQFKSVPIKTMISSLPTKSMIVKTEIMANKDINNDGNLQRRASRRSNKLSTKETVLRTTTTATNGVEKYTNVASVKSNGNHHSQETSSPLQTTTITATANEVKALIKKRLASSSNLLNFNNIQISPQKQQQLAKQQVYNQQQLEQHLQKQQRWFYKKQKQELQQEQQDELNKQQEQLQQQQKQQQQQNYHQEQLQKQHHKNNNIKTLALLKGLNKLNENSLKTVKIQQTQSQVQIKENEQQNKSTRLTETSPNIVITTNKIRQQQRKTNDNLSQTDLLNNKMKLQNSRINLKLNNNNNNNECSDDINNNHSKNNNNINNSNNRQRDTTSAEYTINRQGVPTISKDKTSVEIQCYEKRLKRIEEQIDCYKNEIVSYAYENLRNSQQKLEGTNEFCDKMPEEPGEIRKQCSNNNEHSLYSHKISNKYVHYSASSSSSHCSSESESPPPVRAKPTFTNLPAVYSNNSFYQLASASKRKSEIGTGGSGDNINRHLETSFHDFQRQDSVVHHNQQRLQFKRGVTNLIKAHLQQPRIRSNTTQNRTQRDSLNASHIFIFIIRIITIICSREYRAEPNYLSYNLKYLVSF